MMPYIIVFFVSCVLFEFGKEMEGLRSGRYAAWLCYGFALFVLCAFAGARDLTIGTDTGGYGVYLYNQGMIANNFGSFYDAVNASLWDIAPLYSFFSFVVVKLSGSQFIYLFAIQLAVVTPVFFVVKRVCNRSFGLVMALYLLAFYIPSLNIMRQSVAMGLVLLSLVKFIYGQHIQAALIGVAALATHSSALIVVLFLVILLSMFEKNDANEWVCRKWSQVVMWLSVFGIMVLLIGFREIAGLLSGGSGIGRLFLYGMHDGGQLSLTGALFTVLIVSGSLLTVSALDSRNRAYGTFLACLVTLSIPFYLMSGVDVTIARMSEYCLLFFVPLVGLSLSKRVVGKNWGGMTLVAGACLFRFFVCFVMLGFNQAVPYTSAMLGIY